MLETENRELLQELLEDKYPYGIFSEPVTSSAYTQLSQADLIAVKNVLTTRRPLYIMGE
jgi:hypothetical protein